MRYLLLLTILACGNDNKQPAKPVDTTKVTVDSSKKHHDHDDSKDKDKDKEHGR